MSQIYKIAYVKNNVIDKLYIFIGNEIKKTNDELKKKFKSNPNEVALLMACLRASTLEV